MPKIKRNYKTIFYSILLILLVATVTGLGCKKKTTEEQPSQTPTATSTATTLDLTNALPTSLDELITTNYNLAKQKVLDWHSDATIYVLTIKLPQSLELNNATETYTFGSATDAQSWWTISIAEKTGKIIRAIIPKEDYFGNSLKPMNTYFWKTNYLEAFQLAEKNGGKTFRDSNQDAEVTLTLSHSEPKGWLWWTVEYKTNTGSNLKIRINPFDRTIVDESGNIITSGTTQTTTNNTSTTTQ